MYIKQVFDTLAKLGWYLDYYFYPVSKFNYTKTCKRFYFYHVREIIKNANSKYNISSYIDLNYVFFQPPFRGLLNTLFQARSNNFYFTAKDIAIAINVSIGGYCNDVNNDEIIDFSYHCSSEIKERVKLDRLLSKELARINKNIESVNDSICRQEILQSLLSKKTIFEHYFKTFEDIRFDEEMTIWHESEDQSWVDWQPKNSLVIKMNSREIREGFFLVGFDYSSNVRGSLRIATNDGSCEYFNNDDMKLTVVWAR